MSELRKLKITEMNRLTVDEFKKADKLPLAVVLDEVRSLHNIGAVFRTSDAFLVNRIYLCGITATPPHPEMHKTALGAEPRCWARTRFPHDYGEWQEGAQECSVGL